MKATIESMPSFIPTLKKTGFWVIRGTKMQVVALIHREYGNFNIKTTYLRQAGGTGKYQRWKVRVDVGDRK